ncbi:TetR family transcriptional regulator [Actinomadura rugatobispora]|uniref:TetR family transcriptional regulator n=1 Tax=Actinomadura rugatobispora TaxID=1994 RepID=A0ABW0ZU73_9ACTN|nr:TetR family transcriptional regulator [Actinomadura rugatobispora]
MRHVDEPELARGAGSGLRERKKRRTREALGSAALRLFAERGYEETTIADIAAAADVSPRTFFSYFPSKEDVVFAEVDDRLEEVADRLARRPLGEPPLEALRTAIVEVIEALVSGVGEYGPVQVRLALERPAVRARALQRLMDVQEVMEALLRELCPGIGEIDAVAASGVAVGGMQAVIMHCRRHGYDPLSMRAALDRGLAVVENGLRSVDVLTVPRD